MRKAGRTKALYAGLNEPAAQTDPSRSLSVAFGTALPAPKKPFAARAANGAVAQMPDTGKPQHGVASHQHLGVRGDGYITPCEST
jgi:hypothetical protein